VTWDAALRDGDRQRHLAVVAQTGHARMVPCRRARDGRVAQADVMVIAERLGSLGPSVPPMRGVRVGAGVLACVSASVCESCTRARQQVVRPA